MDPDTTQWQLARKNKGRMILNLLIGNEIQGHRMDKHYEDTLMERCESGYPSMPSSRSSDTL